MDLKEVVATELEAARRRSLGLLDPIDEPDLLRQHSPLMSPLVWDLAHIGNYEDLWLVRALGAPGVRPECDHVYDAFRHPRRNRPSLPLLGPADALAYVTEVRGRALDLLGGAELEPHDPLVADAFVYGMVVQHEHQHDETMLATLQLGGLGPADLGTPPPEGTAGLPAEVLVEGGPFVMGTDAGTWAYDNERSAHVVELAPFWIDTVPVTNRAYAEFVADGGYHQRRWWSDEGWRWRQEAGLKHPQFWRRAEGSWWRERFGREEDLPLDEPVQHVCWHEADAFSRWAGKRLPNEAEWEKAASWDPATGTKWRYPWGDRPPTPIEANLGQRRSAPDPVGSHPAGASPWGCHQMLGDVWEWTSSELGAYPGFITFPYREYSEVFFDSGYKVLRGGSWATHPAAVRTTFRNWDHAIRRQIFAGFRCARGA